MPLPTPTNKEGLKKFLNRCMADEVMTSEYPDTKQRYAVCNSIYKQSKKNFVVVLPNTTTKQED